MLNQRLDHFARDRKVEHSPGVTYGGLMRRAAITLISLQLVFDARLPQPWKLCAVREFDQKLGAANFFCRRSCVRQCDADGATVGEIDT
jgi:hypothetical protein